MKKKISKIIASPLMTKPDINELLQSLDPKKDCQLTFKDIWADYRNFKDAYYYHQTVDLAKQYREQENIVEVDMSKFSLR